mmetsp:Transcript_123976/g.174909  ORF Transcript_123976/g.174909 Transcript_123976/m.174909 type:complete len:137 (+) Transcript_123976:93-503(+)
MTSHATGGTQAHNRLQILWCRRCALKTSVFHELMKLRSLHGLQVNSFDLVVTGKAHELWLGTRDKVYGQVFEAICMTWTFDKSFHLRKLVQFSAAAGLDLTPLILCSSLFEKPCSYQYAESFQHHGDELLSVRQVL